MLGRQSGGLRPGLLIVLNHELHGCEQREVGQLDGQQDAEQWAGLPRLGGGTSDIELPPLGKLAQMHRDCTCTLPGRSTGVHRH